MSTCLLIVILCFHCCNHRQGLRMKNLIFHLLSNSDALSTNRVRCTYSPPPQPLASNFVSDPMPSSPARLRLLDEKHDLSWYPSHWKYTRRGTENDESKWAIQSSAPGQFKFTLICGANGESFFWSSAACIEPYTFFAQSSIGLGSNISGNGQHVIGSTSSVGAVKHSLSMDGFGGGGGCASTWANTSTTQTPNTIKLFIFPPISLSIFMEHKYCDELLPLFLFRARAKLTRERKLIKELIWPRYLYLGNATHIDSVTLIMWKTRHSFCPQKAPVQFAKFINA